MKITIVIVDDSKMDRYVAKRIIDKTGEDRDIKVVEYDTGDAFIEVMKEDERRANEICTPPPPVFVLLDINMPGMSGFDVLESLREVVCDDQFIIVTMYSSSNHAEDRMDALNYPYVKDYVVKPITQEKCRELLETHYPN